MNLKRFYSDDAKKFFNDGTKKAKSSALIVPKMLQNICTQF